MAGCFGNSAEDRYRERELDRYLDSQEDDDREEKDFESRLSEADEKMERERFKDA